MPRETVVAALEGLRPLDLPIPLDEMRESLSRWLDRWWDVVRMQVPKKICPSCVKCRDLQVLDCYRKNEKNINPGKNRRAKR